MPAHPPKPLTARQDPLNDSSAERLQSDGIATGGKWGLPAKLGRDVWLDLPIFSRLIHCNSMSRGTLEDAAAEALASACCELQVPWIGSKGTLEAAPKWRVQTIGLAEPVDSDWLQSAVAVQLQLFGHWSGSAIPSGNSPHGGPLPSQFAAWKPGLPIELASYEHLAPKLDAIRSSLGERKPIGAALIANPQTIYEDVRFLIDAGFDWLEIIQAPLYAFKPQAALELAELHAVLAKAVKAKQDARVERCPLWLTTSSSDPRELARLLEQGIEGLCVDGYLASRAPAQIVPRDTLAGIRVQSVGAGKPDYSWLVSAMKDLQIFLRDVIAFKA